MAAHTGFSVGHATSCSLLYAGACYLDVLGVLTCMLTTVSAFLSAFLSVCVTLDVRYVEECGELHQLERAAEAQHCAVEAALHAEGVRLDQCSVGVWLCGVGRW